MKSSTGGEKQNLLGFRYQQRQNHYSGDVGK
jgi:hypothetical protein